MAYVLSFSLVSLFVDVQINPFRTIPSHSATESQSFRFSVNIFSRPALRGGGGIFSPSPGHEPVLDGLVLEC